MAKYNLCTIRPKGFLHSSAFAEVKDSLAWSLTELGHEVMLTENAFSTTGTNVILGAELLSPDSHLPDNSIVFNMEQPSHPSWEKGTLLKVAEGHPVWDINRRNLELWKASGYDARYLPVGYTPNLTRIPRASQQDIDVAFFGWMTPRRRHVIQQLREAKLSVYASDCCYGGARDQILSRTKVCLNVHHDGRDSFEIVRVSYLMANSKCVLTEPSSDDGDYDWIGESVIHYAYSDLVEHCRWLVNNNKYHTFEEKALATIQSRPFTTAVALVLSPSTSTSLRERYERGLLEGDMRDFLPTLRSLSKGNVLEIGVRDGASTSALLLGLEERGGHLTSVDVEDCSGLWTHPQWRFIRQDSRRCQFEPASFSLALIDGDHTRKGFLADLDNCMRWVQPSGIILCHDITPLASHTKEAAGGDWPSRTVGEEFFRYVKENKLRYFIYPGDWGLGAIIKDEML